MDLDTLRLQINQIDRELVRLLNERARTSLQIGKIKRQQGLAIQNERREQQVLQHIVAQNRGPLSNEQLIEIFTGIISICRTIQQKSINGDF